MSSNLKPLTANPIPSLWGSVGRGIHLSIQHSAKAPFCASSALPCSFPQVTHACGVRLRSASFTLHSLQVALLFLPTANHKPLFHFIITPFHATNLHPSPRPLCPPLLRMAIIRLSSLISQLSSLSSRPSPLTTYLNHLTHSNPSHSLHSNP